MAMGKRKARQSGLWVAASELPRSPGHPFYAALNRLLDGKGFDAFVEEKCAPFYADAIGRPSLAPGRYFRLFLIGYFEGLDSERAIAWRAADSLGVRSFIGLDIAEAGPDHSTISRTRRRIDVETHRAVFSWVLGAVAQAGLLSGKTLGVDATTLEANAAMRSILRRDTGESYQEYLAGLAAQSGIKTPTREALARLDRRRKKKGSNDDWGSPTDPDAKITKMKDGRTHLAHKAEHAVDLDSGAIVAVTVQGANVGDTSSIVETLIEAAAQLAVVKNEDASLVHPNAPLEIVADKGYHSDATMIEMAASGLRSYVSEPDRGGRRWRNKEDARDAVYANRRRIRGERGRRLLRGRSELLERPFAHLFGTGGMRRTHLRGHDNILKRLLVHVGAFNLGLILRMAFGVGTPRALQSRIGAFLRAVSALMQVLVTLWTLLRECFAHDERSAVLTVPNTQPFSRTLRLA